MNHVNHNFIDQYELVEGGLYNIRTQSGIVHKQVVYCGIGTFAGAKPTVVFKPLGGVNHFNINPSYLEEAEEISMPAEIVPTDDTFEDFEDERSNTSVNNTP